MAKKAEVKNCEIMSIKMDDTQAPPIGTIGTVWGVDCLGSILVHWDTGSSLSVIYGEDIIRKVGK